MRERKMCGEPGCGSKVWMRGRCRRHQEKSAPVAEFTRTVSDPWDSDEGKTHSGIDLTGGRTGECEDDGVYLTFGDPTEVVSSDRPMASVATLEDAVCAVIAAAVHGALPERDRELLKRVL